MVSDILTAHYRSLRQAKADGRPIAWTSLGFPKQILYALGLVPVYPQFHAAFQSVRGKASAILKAVEAEYDIPHDICGEVKAMIGTVLQGDKLAFRLPPPDLLIGSNNVCGAADKGLTFIARRLDKPHFFCDFPRLSGPAAQNHAKAFLKTQLAELIDQVEDRFGVAFDQAKYNHLLRRDYEAFLVWREIIKLFRFSPPPMEAMDLHFFTLPFYICELEDDRFVDVLIRLYNELYGRIDRTDRLDQAGSGRPIRLLWDALPIYHKGDFFRNLLARNNAVLAMTSYFTGATINSSTMDLLFDHPLTKDQLRAGFPETTTEAMEEAINLAVENDAARPLSHRKAALAKVIKEFSIDGVIIHMDRTCRPVSLPQYNILAYLRDDLGVPTMLFDADTMDERYFATNQIETRIEAFLEQLNHGQGSDR